MFLAKLKTHSISIACGLVILGLLLADCSPEALGITNGDENPTETSTPTKTPTVVPVPGATQAPIVRVEVSSNAALGSFLTDQSGFTFYTSKKDTPGVSSCTGPCLKTWPAVMTSGAPLAGTPSLKGALSVINRPDGGQQVTYNGLPLYYYIKDDFPGSTLGQGLSGDWTVVAP